jgi:Ser/Thr protein kinase RdoA (MazF antagonist)
MSDPLPTEIADALVRAGWRARQARRITTLASPLHRRTVYRIELVSGETIKARQLEDAATAVALCDLRRGLPPAFAPVLARHRRVLLEPWIAGESLRDRAPRADELAAAGALLAALHATPVAPAAASATERVRYWRARTMERLDALVAPGTLDAGGRARLAAALARLDPGTAAIGLIHTDFCGENMVVDAAGALHVIDNERIGVDALGYDLARTWARWELGDADWARFAAAYDAAGGRPQVHAGQLFWRLVAVAIAAAVRVQLGIATPESFVRLHRLAAELA